jgi:hypothetical protein
MRPNVSVDICETWFRLPESVRLYRQHGIAARQASYIATARPARSFAFAALNPNKMQTLVPCPEL